ncbi:ataxin-2-like protein isoform X3 [Ylistrum balloti]|uniref:ataxin-2-like protein isoform X3 n=1 Tax=Ylistrum balloti TaxID=509963 RepID=UPI002905CE4E|nr:ataxin-2-like protein isoform X3 [Ylistrum balloti]
MMSAQKKNKRGQTPGAARGGRQRGYEKNIITNEGVFANPRFTHLTTSLIGCVVRLQVKNGGIYEGILKTFSPKMDVVLEMAHKCEDLGNNNQNAVPNVPSRERLIEKILFSVGDILTICAMDVDMEYSVKDSFTDSAISKHNGQTGESPLRELQPWVGEDGDELGGLEGGDPANGWDANEMFRTNAEQFNVKSTYDETLKMYTTPLSKTDSIEYKAREEKAAKLAQEIEKTDQYKIRNALENGDEVNEEDKFSSVKRTQDNNTTQSGKYIPPNKRSQHPHPPNRNIPRGTVQNHQYHSLPNRGGPPQRITSPPQPVPVHNPPSVIEETKHNHIEKEETRWGDNTEQSTKASPVPESVEKQDRQQQQQPPTVHTSPVSNKVDRRNSTPKARVAIIEELKGFKKQFKLEEPKDREDVKENQEELTDVTPEKSEDTTSHEPEKADDKKKESNEVPSDIVKKSELNPLAQVFQPKQIRQQIPTPPRPHTQSPMAMPAAIQTAHTGMFHQQQQTAFMLPPAVVSMPTQAPTTSPQLRPAKRAVVSIQGHRPDISAAQATGQPLLAAHSVPPHPQIILQMPPNVLSQHAGFPLSQMMQMPSTTSAAPPRMVTPTSLPMVPTSHPGAIDHNNVSHSGGGGGHIFSKAHSGQSGGHLYGPVPAHIHQFSHTQHPQPAHMGPQQNQPGGQMNPQSNTHHPAPSPVQQQGPTGQSHNQGHPPSSGTPQPHPNYPQMGIQHPPLQASPHNPTSPQTMHTVPHGPYHYTPTANAHAQQNNQPYGLNQGHSSGNSSHNMPGQPTHMPGQAQIVMMPNPQVQQNSQQPQQQPHGPQFQQHAVPHHMAGQAGHINYQTAAMPAMQANNHTNLHQQIPPFVPQVPVHLARKAWIYKTGVPTLTRL